MIKRLPQGKQNNGTLLFGGTKIIKQIQYKILRYCKKYYRECKFLSRAFGCGPSFFLEKDIGELGLELYHVPGFLVRKIKMRAA